MSTASTTRTTVVTSADVRQVMSLTGEEITAICRAAAHLARDFDVDSAMVDVSLLVLNEVIRAVKVQCYVGDELVTEHEFRIASAAGGTCGPPAGQPPLGPLPDGARLRLVTTSNPSIPEETREAWFRRLGWRDAAPLKRPEGVASSQYGRHVSGGMAVDRRLWVNPKYDVPADPSRHFSPGKENCR